MLAGSSPEVLLAAIGAATTHMRIGSGGVMLPHYSPLKVAETFSVLSGLYGDRIDLGVGRAPGSDPGTAFALQRDRRYAAIDDFPEQLAELMAYLQASFPAGHPLARLSALPGRPESPTLWLLGSSPQSAIWAAELGLPYSFADFINPAGAEIARLYRDRYVPSAAHPDAELAIAVSTICAETDDEAEHLASSSRMAITLLRRGRPGAGASGRQGARVPLAPGAVGALAERPPAASWGRRNACASGSRRSPPSTAPARSRS